MQQAPMSSRIFLAGASGAIGRRLVPMLHDAGYVVGGTTRSADKSQLLRSLGAEPMVVDVYDQQALAAAALSFRPDVIVHQLTDLRHIRDPNRRDELLASNARIRNEGTRNLVQAAIAAGAHRIIAQSIAWVYASGPLPHREDDPLDSAAEGNRAVSIAGVIALEDQGTAFAAPAGDRAALRVSLRPRNRNRNGRRSSAPARGRGRSRRAARRPTRRRRNF